MLDATRARHGIELPLADFIQMAAGEDFRQSIIGAGYIGTSRIAGVDCHHLAIRQADVDWQVWIENSQTPVPRKLVITTKTEPTQPQYMATLAWDLAPRIDDSLFSFTPPPTASRIMFARAKDRRENRDIHECNRNTRDPNRARPGRRPMARVRCDDSRRPTSRGRRTRRRGECEQERLEIERPKQSVREPQRFGEQRY